MPSYETKQSNIKVAALIEQINFIKKALVAKYGNSIKKMWEK